MLVVALSVAMVYLGKVGVADFMRLEPCTYLDGVRASNTLPSPDRLEKARERLLLAQKIDSNNPIIPEYLGLVYYYRAQLSDFDAQLKRDFLELALESYARAIKLRPNSGYLWSNVMLTRQALWEGAALPAASSVATSPAAQSELEPLLVSLRHAAQLAPWEPSVVGAVVQVGKQHYAEMGAADQAIMLQAIEHAKKLAIKL